MKNDLRDGKDLNLTAALYASRPIVVNHVRRAARLPDDIPMGAAEIGMRLLVEHRGQDIDLSADEQLVFEAMLREGRLPGGQVVLVPETRMVFEGRAVAVIRALAPLLRRGANTFRPPFSPNPTRHR